MIPLPKVQLLSSCEEAGQSCFPDKELPGHRLLNCFYIPYGYML